MMRVAAQALALAEWFCPKPLPRWQRCQPSLRVIDGGGELRDAPPPALQLVHGGRPSPRGASAVWERSGQLARAASAAPANPLDAWRPTRPQLEFLSATEARVLLRGPNQPGKTTATAVDVLHRMRGTHPWVVLVHRPPIEVWIVCSSWKQSLVIQRKVAALIPRGELHPSSKFSTKNGFSGAAFQLTNGSLCTFVTVQQDTTELASATLHHIAVDEPPPEAIWGELAARVRHHGGAIKLTLTPINRPCHWIKEKVAKGEIRDIHFTLTLDSCWPIGARRPFQTQAQLDQFAKDVPKHQYAQRVLGEWEGTTQGRWIEHFVEADHVRMFSAPKGFLVALGIDYGLRPGKMCCHLVCVKGGHTSAPEVRWWDEACAPESESWGTEDLAVAIVAMLRRNGLAITDVDLVVGDRSAEGKSRRLENSQTRAAIAAILRLPQTALPKFEVPTKWEGSVAYGCSIISGLFRRGLAMVHPRCQRLISAFNHFAGNPLDKVKDALDSGRYPVATLCQPKGWFATSYLLQA